MAQALATPVLPSLSLISNPISNSAKTSLSFPLTTTLPKIGGLSIKCARVGGLRYPTTRGWSILCSTFMESGAQPLSKY
ncbi:UNVERIFIED_CONTAM: hypothetical protein Slati_2286700 [Sesamum latifolium]|uniref:Uncharacterized protein n=1 Tax=Sesamum latifolium TaxID=2727402 RepID=A0AAW2W8X0_9LAMI